MGDGDKVDQAGPTLITMAEFARMKGVTHGAVQDAIKKGRLTPAAFELAPNGTKRLINVEVANREWAVRKRAPVNGAAKESVEAAIAAGKPQGELEAHFSARVKKDEYAAKLAQLEYETKAGKLAKVEDVKIEAFALARMVRDNILNVPDRISHELAAEIDPHKIHIMLTRALTEALEQLATVDDAPDEILTDQSDSEPASSDDDEMLPSGKK